MSKEKDSYYTISGRALAEIKVEKSKFIGQCFPVASKDEIQEMLADVRKNYYDARHHPFAFRLGLTKNDFRYSDDGEPAGSSGKPVLEAIDKFELTDTLVVVTRYFGGVKLGAGGLRRAYGEAAMECLAKCNITEKFLYERVNAEFGYAMMNVVMKLIESEKIIIVNNLSAEKVKLELDVRRSRLASFEKELNNLTNGDAILIKQV